MLEELYLELEDHLVKNKLNGGIELDGNCIVWSYDTFLDNDIDMNDVAIDTDKIGDEIEPSSIEEVLYDKYIEDVFKIRVFLTSINQLNSWHFSKPDILKTKIFFRIF